MDARDGGRVPRAARGAAPFGWRGSRVYTTVARRVAALRRAAALTLAAALMAVPAAQAQSAEAARGAAAPSPLLQLSNGLTLGSTGSPTLLTLGPGDAVSVSVYGRPEFDTTTYVDENLTITVPLAGPVRVGGMSPSAAADAVARALREGEFLVDPQVSITFTQFRSQQVSVLGDVRDPGRFPLESKTTLLDLLALAGGISETGSDVVYLIRPDADGRLERHAIDLRSLHAPDSDIPNITLKAGDSLFVPKAEQFYVYGEVQSPNAYRLQPGTTVVQAISLSGGLTERGSDSRIEIRRRRPNGKYETLSADLTDVVQADDVIRVKERIF